MQTTLLPTPVGLRLLLFFLTMAAPATMAKRGQAQAQIPWANSRSRVPNLSGRQSPCLAPFALIHHLSCPSKRTCS